MESVADDLHCNGFPLGFQSLPFSKQKKIFYDHLYRIIDRYVIPKQFHIEELSASVQDEDIAQNPHVGQICQDHMYISASSRLPKQHLPDTLRFMSDHAYADPSLRIAEA